MWNLLIVAALSLSLGGCLSRGSLVQAQGDCTAHPSYVSAWDCVKARVAANQAGDMKNDLAVKYLAIGDLLAEKVQMTDAEAKAHLAQELLVANREYNSRQAARADAVSGALLEGSRSYQAGVAANRPVTCTTGPAVGGYRTTNCQ